MRALIVKVALCLAVFGLTFYYAIEKQNELTRMRMQIPELAKQVKRLQEENTRLQYQIDVFASPQHLQELLSQNEYAHLKHPYSRNIIALTAGQAVKGPEPETIAARNSSRLPLATGAHP